MSERKEENGYRTYLLRLWCEQAALPQCQPVWRCSIEDTCTRNRRGFGSVEDLANHLRVLAGQPEGSLGSEPASEI
jgi:hypothetical protein